MSQQTLGIIIGGLVPAVLFGICNIFAKASLQTNIALGYYLFIAGISVAAVGIVFFFLTPERSISGAGTLYSIGFGATWGLGSGCVALAIARYHAPLSAVVPLFNMNTLISVLLALWIFSEWKEVHAGRLIAGAALIIIGGTLVAQ